MDTAASYFHAGFVIISLPNLALIVGMVVLFVAALVAPFPKPRTGGRPRR